MFATVRRYEGIDVSHKVELTKKVNETLAPRLSEMPGSRVSHGGYNGRLPAADRWWAGADRYVGSRERLAAEPRPWEYIGWTYNPADLELLRILAWLGFHPPSGGKLHNHLSGSWIWSDPELSLKLSVRSGQYYVYQIGTRGSAHS